MITRLTGCLQHAQHPAIDFIEEALYVSRQSLPIRSDTRKSSNDKGSSSEHRIASLRKSFELLGLAQNEIQKELTSLLPDPKQAMRSGYLRSLSELIGPRPTDRSWEDEWARLYFDMKRERGELKMATDDHIGEFSDLNSNSDSQSSLILEQRKEDGKEHIVAKNNKDVHLSKKSTIRNTNKNAKITSSWVTTQRFTWGPEDVPKGTAIDLTWIKMHQTPEALSDLNYQHKITEGIRQLTDAGRTLEESKIMTLLLLPRKQISEAMQKGDRKFAASTYTICEVFSRLCHQQEEEGNNYAPLLLFRPLTGGLNSLSYFDSEWLDIEKPDTRGFRGYCSLAAIRADASSHRFSEDGMNLWSVKNKRLEVVDSPVVGFLSSPENEEGYHAAIMFSKATGGNDDKLKGYFPPNCLFRVKEIREGGFAAPGDIWVKQKLIIVTATFRSPYPKRSETMLVSNKLCGSVTTLSYGNREVYVDGLDKLIPSKPLLTMSQEFERDYSWRDWHGVQYDIRKEWEYVNGISEEKTNCVSGVRDRGDHANLSPQNFLNRVNDRIASRREIGLGIGLNDRDAFLSMDEVLSVRLYSGPAYLPINTFLREISACSGEYRRILCNHPLRSFTATCRHISNAIRKIAAVATKSDVSKPLWRGVRGELKRSFWNLDEQGMICAVDTAFMSCSRSRDTPIQYMSQHTSNVLWKVQPASESDAAYHNGADISMLSQFPDEKEVLFPPCTMLVVRNKNPSDNGAPVSPDSKSSALWEQKDCRKFIQIEAKPAFV
mmetsp:Transcript_18409/g.27975  ORF Transcript_18409/g.27975 Transcript_18409/m.27975 type:complete len:774 (+) Transcript_18409:71-2392(+)